MRLPWSVSWSVRFTTEIFRKDGYEFTAYDNGRDILYNVDAITPIVTSTVHSPEGKLTYQ